MGSLSQHDIRKLLPPAPGLMLSQEGFIMDGLKLSVLVYQHEIKHNIFLVYPPDTQWKSLNIEKLASPITKIITGNGLQIGKIQTIAIYRSFAYNTPNAAVRYYKVFFRYDPKREIITDLESRYLCKKDVWQIASSEQFSLKLQGGQQWKIT